MYSRATTSEMAERDFLPVVVFLGCVLGLSFGMAAVCGASGQTDIIHKMPGGDSARCNGTHTRDTIDNSDNCRRTTACEAIVNFDVESGISGVVDLGGI